PAAYVKKMITNEYLSWRRRKAAKDVTMSHAALDDVGTAATDAVHRYEYNGDIAERRWVGTSSTDWTVEYALWQSSHVTALRFTARSPHTAGGRPVRAHGVDAPADVPSRQQDGGMTDPLLVVPVGDKFPTTGGRSSTIPGGDIADLPLETMVDIANTTVVDPDPDISWFGTRQPVWYPRRSHALRGRGNGSGAL
ncbi:MAG: hypothetical protein ABWY11_20995, partial [Umezawaea sp.]